MPDRPKFFTSVQVRYNETDLQGHVFFGNYNIYFDFALTEYLKAAGYGYDDFLREGVDFFYAESLCKFKGRAFFEEVLHVHVGVEHIGNSSFTFSFAAHEEKSDRLVCTGRIVAVAVDRETHRTVPVPRGFRDAVAAFGGTPPGAETMAGD